MITTCKLNQHLLNLEFERKLPWQYHSESYMVVYLDTDSFGFEVYSITNKRYDSISYRGRIFSPTQFDRIFSLVKEDYDLSEEEINQLKQM